MGTSTPAPALRRSLGLTLLTLYGIGVTVGAGIYVLIGVVAQHAGMMTPLAFLVAAVVMGLTVASYAELCTRFPWRPARRHMCVPPLDIDGCPPSPD